MYEISLRALRRSIATLDREKANASTVGGIANALNHVASETAVQQLAAALADKADASAIPQPADAMPPAVSDASLKGGSQRYALADHTHASSVQAARVTGTPNAQGEITWTFPTPFSTGTVPVVAAVAEQPGGASYTLNVVLKSGAVTRTGVTVIVQRISNSFTMGLLNSLLSIIVPQTQACTIHLWARKPTA